MYRVSKETSIGSVGLLARSVLTKSYLGVRGEGDGGREERSDVLHRVGATYLYILHNVHRPCLVVLGALRAHVT